MMHLRHSLPLCACTLALAATLGLPAAAGEPRIAFVSIRDGNPHLYVKDGRAPERQITFGASSNTQPAWSPDGTWLAFTSTREGLLKIHLIKSDGSEQKRLTSEDRIESSPSWAPDGSAIAYFSANPVDASAELRIVELQRGTTIRVLGNGLGKGPTPPSWSADGQRLAFSGIGPKAKNQVWVVDRDGSSLREISSQFSPRDKAFAAISPDGRRVAYVADMRGSADLVVTEIDSLQSRNLSASQKSTKNENPHWSPDGRRLLFGSTRDDPDAVRMDIFVANADGSEAVNLTRHPHEDFDARWADDGRSVIFTSLRTGTGQLFQVELQGPRTVRLTSHASHDMDAAPIQVAPKALARASSADSPAVE